MFRIFLKDTMSLAEVKTVIFSCRPFNQREEKHDIPSLVSCPLARIVLGRSCYWRMFSSHSQPLDRL